MPHRALLLSGLVPSLRVERPGSDSSLLAALQAGAGWLHSHAVLDAALGLVVTMAQAVVASADGASITLPRDGRLGTVASTNDVVLQMDHDQYDTGQGPCVDAAEQGERFQIRSLAAEQRWPEFVPRARARGIHSILSTPLTTGTATVGALNVYSRHEAAFAEHEIRWADQFASEAAKVIQSAAAGEPDRQLQQQIRDALRSREIIARAEGAVMARDGVAEAVAQATLRTASRSRRTPMRTLCQDLLTGLGQRNAPIAAGGSAHERPPQR
jgi:signal transduction protein with GAF and PtsI domain